MTKPKFSPSSIIIFLLGMAVCMHSCHHHENDISYMQEQIIQLKNEIDSLQIEKTWAEENIESLKHRISRTERELSELEDKVIDQELKISK